MQELRVIRSFQQRPLLLHCCRQYFAAASRLLSSGSPRPYLICRGGPTLLVCRAHGGVPSAAAPVRSQRRSAWRRITAQSAATATDTEAAAPAGSLAGSDELGSPLPLPTVGQPGEQPPAGQPAASRAQIAAGAGLLQAEAVAAAAAPPVALAASRSLPAQASLEAALAALRQAVAELPAEAGAYASALVRLEVPVPRGTRPLWWLRGQSAAAGSSADSSGTGANATAAMPLHPRIYFSPRRTTAADTEGSAAAGAAAAGAGSVAGAGAAWLWRGAPGQALDEAVVRDMQRFLAASAANPRVRAFGGARFNAGQAPASEWAEFGSYCFMIPRWVGAAACTRCVHSLAPARAVLQEGGCCRIAALRVHAWEQQGPLRPAHCGLPDGCPPLLCRLELLEASSCSIVACTVVWDANYHAADSSSGSAGFASADAAVADALAALDAARPAAPPAAGAFKLQRHGAAHTPDEAGWRQLMDGTHAQLAAAAAAAEATEQRAEGGGDAADGVVDACTPMLKICPDAAREEYLLNGQEGLDDLLAALDGGFEATTAPQARPCPQQRLRVGGAGLREQATPACCSHGPPPCCCPPLCPHLFCSPLAGWRLGPACARGACRLQTGSPHAAAASNRLAWPATALLCCCLQDGGLTKVVLARRTDVAISGRLDPLSLLEALGERDPRAYQIMLQVPPLPLGLVLCRLCASVPWLAGEIGLPGSVGLLCSPHGLEPVPGGGSTRLLGYKQRAPARRAPSLCRCPLAPLSWAPRPSACTHAPGLRLRQRLWLAPAPAAQVGLPRSPWMSSERALRALPWPLRRPTRVHPLSRHPTPPLSLC